MNFFRGLARWLGAYALAAFAGYTIAVAGITFHNLVRLAVPRMDSPVGFRFCIDRFGSRDGWSFVEIRGRPRDHPRGRGAAGIGREQAELGQMEIAVIPTARPALRHGLVRQNFQANCVQFPLRSLQRDHVRIALRAISAD